MIRKSSRPAPVGAVLLDLVLPRGRRIEQLSPGNLHKRELGQMSTRFVSKRQSIAPGSRLCGERQGISALESGLVKAKLELLPDSALSESAISVEQQGCRVSREPLGAKRRPRRAMNIAAGYRG